MKAFLFSFLWGFSGFLLYRISAYYTFDENMNTSIPLNLAYATAIGIIVGVIDVLLLGGN